MTFHEKGVCHASRVVVCGVAKTDTVKLDLKVPCWPMFMSCPRAVGSWVCVPHGGWRNPFVTCCTVVIIPIVAVPVPDRIVLLLDLIIRLRLPSLLTWGRRGEQTKEKEALVLSESKAEEGDVDGSMLFAKQAETFAAQHEALQKQLTTPDRVMTVCEVCGVFINLVETDRKGKVGAEPVCQPPPLGISRRCTIPKRGGPCSSHGVS